MRILVTGARGKVGAATVDVLHRAGHEVTASDRIAPVFEAAPPWPSYRQADLADAGDAFAIVAGQDAVVHAAALPDPQHNPPHVVFSNNLMATFNVIEAAVRLGVGRVVHVSSETVPGFFFAERPFGPPTRRSTRSTRSRRRTPTRSPSTSASSCATPPSRARTSAASRCGRAGSSGRATRESNLGPLVRDPEAVSVSWNSYVDVYDLAELLRLAAESDLPGHEVVLRRAARQRRRPLARGPCQAPLRRPAARSPSVPTPSGISTAKACACSAGRPQRSWRDYLDDEGRLLPEVRERLERGDTGVHRGRAAGTPP